MIWGATLVNLLPSTVRTKFVAMFVGSAVVGLAGTCNNLMSLTATLTNAGRGSSGVKHIAAACKEADQDKQASTLAVFYRLNYFTAVISFLVLVLFGYPISLYSFDSANYAIPIAETIHREMLSLPMSPMLSDAEVDQVILAINQYDPDNR